MRRFWTFLKAHYRAYDLFPDYFRAIKHAGWDVIWAPLAPSIVYWLLWFRPNPPSWWVTLLYAVWVVILAGYFVWRKDQVRLKDKIGIGEVSAIYSGTSDPNIKRRFVQILVKCTTEGSIHNCRGQLLRVSKGVKDSDGHNGRWEATHIAETLDLLWSFVDEPTVTLEHGAPRRLNVFFVDNTSRKMVIWTRLHVRLISAPLDRFKFDVRVAGDEYMPKYISVEVTVGDHWNDLTDLCLETTKNET